MGILLSILINLILLLGFFFFFNRKINKRIEPSTILDSIQQEINSIIIELNQTTDRNIGLIEDRIKTLNTILEKADKRIQVLKKEAEKYNTGTEVYSDIIKKRMEAKRQEEDPAKPQANTQEKILDLYRKGISPTVIARRIGATVGEVELVISLDDGRSLG